MRTTNDTWMAYIDGEVRSVCKSKGWGHQIRRRWAVRDKPVAESPLEDFEWKIIPGAKGDLGETGWTDFDEGTYYVLGYDRCQRALILQHDTKHCGLHGPHWNWSTYTRIDLPQPGPPPAGPDWVPPAGWLAKTLIELTRHFEPNTFCIT